MRNAILSLVILISGTGCAQVMAASQPKPIDQELFVAGMSRGEVSGRLGSPATSDDRGDELIESYNYTDGGGINSMPGKAFRILLYTAGDVFTVFLTQILWIPIEIVLDGTEYTATVDYVKDDHNRWIASSMVETTLDGDREVAVLIDDSAGTESELADVDQVVIGDEYDTALVGDDIRGGNQDLNPEIGDGSTASDL
jgi:hypothetical protein